MSDTLRIVDAAALFMVLRAFGNETLVPILEKWGKGEAKGLNDLAEEINAGESQLVIDASGIRRVLKVVRMDIEDPILGTLLHAKTILPDGRERILNRRPSGKIIAGENPAKALERELGEELELGVDDYFAAAKPVVIEDASSKSYPGLRCQYEIHPFSVELADTTTSRLANGKITTEKDSQVLHFAWDKNFVPMVKS